MVVQIQEKHKWTLREPRDKRRSDMTVAESQSLLNEYAATIRALPGAVEFLRRVTLNIEAIIGALAEAGTGRCLYQRSRIALDKRLAQRWRTLLNHPGCL